MHTFRPPAGASFSFYSRLIGGALALALTCAGDTLGAQTFTSNLRGYVRIRGRRTRRRSAGRHAGRRDEPASDDDDQRDRLLLRRRTEARTVRGDAQATRLRGAIATDPPCDRPDPRPRLRRGRGDAAARRRGSDSDRRRRVAHLRGRHQRLAAADRESAKPRAQLPRHRAPRARHDGHGGQRSEQGHQVGRTAGRGGERVRRRRELQERRAQGRRRRPGREQGQPVPAGRGAGVPRHHAELQGRIPEGGERGDQRDDAQRKQRMGRRRLRQQHREELRRARRLHAPQCRPRVPVLPPAARRQPRRADPARQAVLLRHLRAELARRAADHQCRLQRGARAGGTQPAAVRRQLRQPVPRAPRRSPSSRGCRPRAARST